MVFVTLLSLDTSYLNTHPILMLCNVIYIYGLRHIKPTLALLSTVQCQPFSIELSQYNLTIVTLYDGQVNKAQYKATTAY